MGRTRRLVRLDGSGVCYTTDGTDFERAVASLDKNGLVRRTMMKGQGVVEVFLLIFRGGTDS